MENEELELKNKIKETSIDILIVFSFILIIYFFIALIGNYCADFEGEVLTSEIVSEKDVLTVYYNIYGYGVTFLDDYNKPQSVSLDDVYIGTETKLEIVKNTYYNSNHNNPFILVFKKNILERERYKLTLTREKFMEFER